MFIFDLFECNNILNEQIKKKTFSVEPDLNQWPKDAHDTTTVLRSTNWAIDGMCTRTF